MIFFHSSNEKVVIETLHFIKVDLCAGSRENLLYEQLSQINFLCRFSESPPLKPLKAEFS
jgi:hypothetical protein